MDLKRLLPVVALVAVSLSSLSLAAPEEAAELDPATLKMFGALPARFESEKNPITDAKVDLGRMLFHEARLSKNHDVSCNSCHLLDRYGVDGQQFSSGHRKQLGGRNAPAVYNAGAYIAQFWDGRAGTLEDQAKGPVTNPVEMAMSSGDQVVTTLKSIPQYVKLFKKAFPAQEDPVSFDNMALAIGAFERRLVTPGRFDRFLSGDKAALTPQEKTGLQKFVKTGCTACHNGPALGGGSFQKLGLVVPYPDQSDLGRYAVTKQEQDRMMFRVPSLRNAAKTGPYFHNGKIARLEDAVRAMAKHQLGQELGDQDVADITAFLNALTGELPKSYIRKPKLPASTSATPKPDPS